MLYAPVPKKNKKKKRRKKLKSGKIKNDFVGERIKLFHSQFPKRKMTLNKKALAILLRTKMRSLSPSSVSSNLVTAFR